MSAVSPWKFVAAFGAGSIWNVDGQAVYVRFDRKMQYPTFEGQEYWTGNGTYVVSDGRWVRKAVRP